MRRFLAMKRAVPRATKQGRTRRTTRKPGVKWRETDEHSFDENMVVDDRGQAQSLMNVKVYADRAIRDLGILSRSEYQAILSYERFAAIALQESLRGIFSCRIDNPTTGGEPDQKSDCNSDISER
jgi:hypothetical protein